MALGFKLVGTQMFADNFKGHKHTFFSSILSYD